MPPVLIRVLLFGVVLFRLFSLESYESTVVLFRVVSLDCYLCCRFVPSVFVSVLLCIIVLFRLFSLECYFVLSFCSVCLS